MQTRKKNLHEKVKITLLPLTPINSCERSEPELFDKRKIALPKVKG
jgi:hypothetical protein